MQVKEWAEKQYNALIVQRSELLRKPGEVTFTLMKIEGALETLQALYQAAQDEDNQSVGEETTKET